MCGGNTSDASLNCPFFLFFLGFMSLTGTHQNKVELKGPIMVGFFLGGLITHGGLQAWWIAPVLGSLAEVPLMLTATILTAFNDNAAITYLATLVPNFPEISKYAPTIASATPKLTKSYLPHPTIEIQRDFYGIRN